MNKESAMSKYILVYPHELADIRDPWKGYSEDDYKNFMSDKTVQEYITAFNVDDPNYQRPYMVNGSNLQYVFLDSGQAPCVVMSPNGYVCGTNGRHRLYICKISRRDFL